MKPKGKFPTITVGDFYTRYSESLGMTLLGSAAGFDRIVKEPTINRPGLALSGFFDYFAAKRIQVLGAAELAYLRKTPPNEVRERMRAIIRRRVPCLVIARGSRPPKHLLEETEAGRISVFQTSMVTMNFINAATLALEREFAPTVLEHGSMVDILGVGTLVRGSAGIGKSECVLGLLERGYPLIADDVTRLRLIDSRHLVATAPDLTRHHMEVRGVGIINVSSMFGIRAVRMEKVLDLIVTLKDWQELEEPDRIGLNQQFHEILGIQVPHITIPVRIGRDLSRLVEVAALDQKLKSMGQDSAKEFNDRLLNSMQRKP
ncbi:MAG: HPr(Ser) kinase/phosphatase [Chthoniobacteraceae bacterium]